MKSARILFVTLAGVLVTAAMVHGGTTNTWKTTGTTVWNLGSNWNPDPGGAPSDAVNIGTTTAANAPDLGGNPYTIKQLYLAGNSSYINGNGVKGSGGPLTLTADSVGFAGVGLRTFNNYTAYVYANLRLGMASRTTEHIWNLVSRSAGGSALYVLGKIDGTGTLHITGTLANVLSNGGGVLYYLNQYDGATTGAPFNGDTIIDMKSSLVFYPSNFTSSVNYRFGENASSTWGGTITLTAGSDALTAVPSIRFAPISGTATPTTATLQNDFVVSSMPGATIGMQRGICLGTYSLPKVVYGGTLTLGGRLNITSSGDSGTPTVPGRDGALDSSAFVPFPNGILIDQTAATRASIRLNRNGSLVEFPGVVSDKAGPYRNPLILGVGDGQVRLNAANSTYTNGTVISWCGDAFYSGTFHDLGDNSITMRIDAYTAKSLGNGNLTTLPGGRILLDVGGVMTSGQQVLLQGNTAALSVVGVVDDGTAAHLPSFSGHSYGVIALSGTSGTPFKDLMANGVSDNVFLGAGMVAGTFNGTSLKPGSDNVYRIGGCSRNTGAPLTIDSSLPNNMGVLTGDNSVQVNFPAYNGGGTVYLEDTNTFTGTLTVYSSLLNSGLSMLRGRAYGMASMPFGSPTGAVDLKGAVLQIYNNATATATAILKGATTFTSDSQIYMANAGATTLQTFTMATLSRIQSGILLVRDTAGTPSLGTYRKILVATPGPELTPINNMVPPYYLSLTGANYDFVTYGGNGFAAVTYSANKLGASADTDLVNQDVAVGLTANRSCYALRAAAAITAATTEKVRIGSGGLILSADIGTANSPTVNVDFSNQEAVVYCTANSTIYGVLSNTGGKGLTKSGSGSLTITNLNNSFTGPITVNRNYLYYTPDKDDDSAPGSLGPVASNNIFLNGGWLFRQSTGVSPAGYRTLSGSRTITLGPLGGGLGAPPSSSTITVKSKLTGPGVLFFSGGSEAFVIDNANNDYSGGTLICANTANTGVTATGKLGQGPVILFDDLFQVGSFYFAGDDNLHYTGLPSEKFLPVQVSGASTAYFRSAAPVMGALTGEGDVVLGNATGPVDTTLTVGKDNADATFYGFLSQVFGRTCSLVKDGTGTWNLYGAQSYSGQTTVTNGTLNLMGSLKGACNVGPAGAISGLGLVSGGLTLNGGTFAVQLSANTPVLQVTGGLNIKAGSKLSLSFAPGFNPGMQQLTVLTTTTGITTPGNLTVVTGGITARAVGNNLVVSRATGTVLEVR